VSIVEVDMWHYIKKIIIKIFLKKLKKERKKRSRPSNPQWPPPFSATPLAVGWFGHPHGQKFCP
jgi:hypothetical protein